MFAKTQTQMKINRVFHMTPDSYPSAAKGLPTAQRDKKQNNNI